MTPAQIEAAGDMLLKAEATRQQYGLLSLQDAGMTLDDAYAVQSAVVRKKRANGARVIGWKIGLTSRAMQSALNITTPDSDVLLDDMLFTDGSTIPSGRFIQPRIEAEIAFVMKSPLQGAHVTRADVLAATDYVAPSLEILDTRNRAGAPWIDVMHPSGRDFPLQPHFGVNRITNWSPSVSTTITTEGLPITPVGTVSTPTLAATNLAASMRRWRLTSAAGPR